MKALPFALVALLATTSVQAQQPSLFEDGFLGAIAKLPTWVDSVEVRFSRFVDRQKAQQVGRRMDRFAKGLYRLCASKDEFLLSLGSPLATDDELRTDARQLVEDIREFRERFNAVGESLVRAGEAASVDNEAAIRIGLNSKLGLLDQLARSPASQALDRSKAQTQANQAATICRQAQQAASSAAARMAGS